MRYKKGISTEDVNTYWINDSRRGEQKKLYVKFFIVRIDGYNSHTIYSML